MNVDVIVLTGFGINCDLETQRAFERAGGRAERVHLNDLVNAPSRLERAHILAAPGGFSFGDDVASGRILANRLRHKLGEPLRAFVRAGKLAIGICNGFQVLVKMGILPLFDGEFRQDTTLTHNDSGRFEDRWVELAAETDGKCVWLAGMSGFELPVRHGEGKFMTANEDVLQRLHRQGQAVLRYAQDGQPAAGAYPANPNGSVDDIAGICDPSGRLFGLMPHPEAYVDREHHPAWTRRPDLPAEGPGLQVFRNAVEFARGNLA